MLVGAVRSDSVVIPERLRRDNSSAAALHSTVLPDGLFTRCQLTVRYTHLLQPPVAIDYFGCYA